MGWGKLRCAKKENRPQGQFVSEIQKEALHPERWKIRESLVSFSFFLYSFFFFPYPPEDEKKKKKKRPVR